MQDAIKAYIKALQKEFATGHATEHTYRPALKTLLESVIPGVLAINEPKPTTFGAPDFAVNIKEIPVGYIEAKNIGVSLDDAKHKKQVARYTQALDNLIYTDYLTFRLIREGKQVDEARIAEVRGKKITALPIHYAKFANLIKSFADYDGQTITTAADLAGRMAIKARMMAGVITKALEQDGGDFASGEASALQGQMSAFREYLIHDINVATFADIYAQTVAYGMFAARLHDSTPATFTRQKAAELIPVNNPFLRKFFQHIAGYDLDERIRWIVDDLADVFRAADVGELMKGHGKTTQKNDPFMHFYETFLGAYNPKLRKSRGVYYTPEPVVNFIVRAVDEILRTEFGILQGLADTTKTVIEIDAQPSTDSGKGKSAKRKKQFHKVQILDPATGTGTFLAAIVKHIHETYFASQKGIWPDYARQELIPRLNGFEVLMAPYAMAHTKLEMVLRESGCDLGDERLRIFLTNALEEHDPATATSSLFAQWLFNEAEEANRIKRDSPVMVVIGNPPYRARSSNKGKWITELIEQYKYVDGEHFGERKHWLHDDYVKFIRYGQHYIDRTGVGVLAFINNHSFLDNPTFRGMRWSLLQSFDAIYVLDLHGHHSKKKENAPDGSADENVFDIQQGVSINLFVKLKNKNKQHSRRDRSRPVPTKAIDNNAELARVFHYDLYGKRKSKYDFLWANNLKQVGFKELKPEEPYYFFIPKDLKNQSEYDKGFKISQLFPNNVTGIVTMGDAFILANSKKDIVNRVRDFLDNDYSEQELKEKYSLGKNYAGWIIGRKTAIQFDEKKVVPISYRPFDVKWTVYDNRLLWRWRNKTMRHFLMGENVGLIVPRQAITNNWSHIQVVSTLIDNRIHYSNKGIPILCPLYLYPDTEQPNLDNQPNLDAQPTREPNLAPNIVQTIAADLGLRFTPEKEADPKTFAPIDLLDYIYAVLHSPAYREKYKEFLKIDFPRVPYPTDKKQFRQLAELGGQLRTLHLMESPTLDTLITIYNISGDNIITKPEFKITNHQKRLGKVHINKTQCFENVPETAWNFYIGGYQPAQKWLKDRKGRTLNYDDLEHYQKIIVALFETERLMGEIDKCECL